MDSLQRFSKSTVATIPLMLVFAYSTKAAPLLMNPGANCRSKEVLQQASNAGLWQTRECVNDVGSDAGVHNYMETKTLYLIARFELISLKEASFNSYRKHPRS